MAPLLNSLLSLDFDSNLVDDESLDEEDRLRDLTTVLNAYVLLCFQGAHRSFPSVPTSHRSGQVELEFE
jgi:hypothetical protein